MEPIPHSRPWINEEDIKAVTDVMRSAMLAQGERTRALELRLASWLGLHDGVGVASGSAGMVLALHGLGVRAGDEVILPSYVCRSVLQAILTVGSIPVLCDIGENWVMTPGNATRLISAKTRAIVVPHLYGIFADIEAFRELSIPIVEDRAQAFGAVNTHPAKGDVTVLSFHPTKCLTGGEGGMALSSQAKVLERMRAIRDGVDSTLTPRLFSPLSDMAASLVLSQLDRYGNILSRRKEIATQYTSAIQGVCPDSINQDALRNSMFFRFPICVPGGINRCKDDFARFGIQVRMGVDALLHHAMHLDDTQFPVTVKLFNSTVSLPIYPALTAEETLRCVNAIKSVLPHHCETRGESS